MSTRYKLSQYLVVTDPVTDGKDGRTKRVVYATRKATVRIVDEELWSRLERSPLEELPEETLRELIDAQILVGRDEDELGEILDGNGEMTVGGSLYLVVQPTAWCQLGCGYCGQKHTTHQLSRRNQDRLIQHVRSQLRSGRFKMLDICWFGGEPLAGLRVMRLLSRRFRSLAEEFGCGYRAKIVTNGLALTEEVAEELVRDMAVGKIEVTLDGDAEYHDRRRPTRSGAGSFQRIFDNIAALARRDDLDVKLTVRCNVDRDNRDGVLALMRRLVEEGIHRRINNFYVSPVYNWGNHAGDRNASREEFAGWEIQWLVEMVKLGFDVGLVPRRRPISCMGVNPHAALVDPHGTFFNCTEVPLVEGYQQPSPQSLPLVRGQGPCGSSRTVNRYAIGDLAGGVDPQRRLFQGFNERIRRGVYPCRTCRLLPTCGGQCPKKWEDGELPCPPTRFNIKQRLLLSYALGRIQLMGSGLE